MTSRRMDLIVGLHPLFFAPDTNAELGSIVVAV